MTERPRWVWAPLAWLAAVVLISVSLAAAGAPGASSGSPVAQGVAADATAENSQRKFAVGPDGLLYLTYTRQLGERSQVFLAISRDQGRTWRHMQVSSSNAFPSRLPSLAAFGDGSVHVVWTEYAPVGRVLYRVLRGGRWTPTAVLSRTGNYAGVPVIAPAGGQPYVLWYGIRPERPNVRTRHGSIYEILATRRDAGRWTAPQVISPGFPDSINPALDRSGPARLEAAWFQFDGRAYQIRVAAFGGGWSPPRSITTGGVDHTRVALAADGPGVHLVWEEGALPSRVMYRRLNGEPLRLSEAGDAYNGVIAARGARVVAAWQEAGSIMLRSLQPLGSRRVVGRGTSPAIALDGGLAYVAWTDLSGSVPELRFTSIPLP